MTTAINTLINIHPQVWIQKYTNTPTEHKYSVWVNTNVSTHTCAHYRRREPRVILVITVKHLKGIVWLKEECLFRKTCKGNVNTHSSRRGRPSTAALSLAHIGTIEA